MPAPAASTKDHCVVGNAPDRARDSQEAASAAFMTIGGKDVRPRRFCQERSRSLGIRLVWSRDLWHRRSWRAGFRLSTGAVHSQGGTSAVPEEELLRRRSAGFCPADGLANGITATAGAAPDSSRSREVSAGRTGWRHYPAAGRGWHPRRRTARAHRPPERRCPRRSLSGRP